MGCLLAFPTISVAKPEGPRFPLELPGPNDRSDHSIDLPLIRTIPDCENGDDDWFRKIGQDLLTIITAPVQCAIEICQMAGSSAPQVDVDKDLIRTCVQSMPWLIGNHVFSCFKNNPHDYNNCGEKIELQTEKGTEAEDICIDGGVQSMTACQYTGPRKNEVCSSVTRPDDIPEDQFVAQYGCIAEKLTTHYGYDWDLFATNCGSISSFLISCLGGTVKQPGLLNLHVGCDWQNIEFHPNSDAAPISGAELCAQLKSECECSPIV